jgi:hypothetical protein
MKEPELEEEALRAEPMQDRIVIERRSLSAEPRAVQLHTPGGEVRTVELEPVGEGRARATVAAEEAGLYEVTDGELSSYAAVRPIGARELADLRATEDKLGPLVEASGGAVRWLAEDGLPDIRLVGGDRSLAGRGWLGLRENERYVVTGASQVPLLPAVLALVLLLGTLGLAWYREGR